ncbi:hypothetical protein RBH89_18410 [Paracidovorax avenae]
MSGNVSTAFDALAPLFVEAVTTCEDGVITETKTITAMSLYLGQLLEASMRARLLTLMMVLEILAPDMPKHKSAVSMLKRMKLEIDMRICEELNEDERFALESLQRELDFRKETSIRRRVRELVMTSVGLKDADREQLARDVVRAYDLRGRIVHTGVAGDNDICSAYETVLQTTKEILRGRLGLK